jgi:hypothetical protein
LYFHRLDETDKHTLVTTSLAHEVVGEALRRRYRGTLQVATQERPLEPIDVSRRRNARLPVQTSFF